MPARYEGIKRSMMKKGMSEKEAEGHAARIFNATRKRGEAPVTGPHRKRRPKMAR